MPTQRDAAVNGLKTMMDVFVGLLEFAPAPARILVLTFMIFLSWFFFGDGVQHGTVFRQKMLSNFFK
jgi:hypothetical protein